MSSIGLDIGTKRTGVAVSVGNFAKEYATLANSGNLPQQIADLVLRHEVDRIIIGLPMLEDGSRSAQCGYVEEMGQLIKEATQLPVAYVDEVFTTLEAHRLLELEGLDREAMEQRMDQKAAQLILQQYIDSPLTEHF